MLSWMKLSEKIFKCNVYDAYERTQTYTDVHKAYTLINSGVYHAKFNKNAIRRIQGENR